MFGTAFRNGWPSLRITYPLYSNGNILGMISILKFLSKAVIYSPAHSTKAGTVLCDWFLRAITVEGTRINVGIHQSTAAHDVVTLIVL